MTNTLRKYNYDNSFMKYFGSDETINEGYMDHLRNISTIPKNEGYSIYDIDAVMYNKHKNIAFMTEVKTHVTYVTNEDGELHNVLLSKFRGYQKELLEKFSYNNEIGGEFTKYNGLWLFTFKGMEPSEGGINSMQYINKKWQLKEYNMNKQQFDNLIYKLLSE